VLNYRSYPKNKLGIRFFGGFNCVFGSLDETCWRCMLYEHAILNHRMRIPWQLAMSVWLPPHSSLFSEFEDANLHDNADSVRCSCTRRQRCNIICRMRKWNSSTWQTGSCRPPRHEWRAADERENKIRSCRAGARGQTWLMKRSTSRPDMYL